MFVDQKALSEFLNLANFFVSMYVDCVCIFIYVNMYRDYVGKGTCACVRICMWRPEADSGTHSSLFLRLTHEAEALNLVWRSAVSDF